jgi:hypothetical protein
LRCPLPLDACEVGALLTLRLGPMVLMFEREAPDGVFAVALEVPANCGAGRNSAEPLLVT